MQLNSIIFPAPNCSYSYDDIGMFYVPKTFKSQQHNPINSVPPSHQNSQSTPTSNYQSQPSNNSSNNCLYIPCLSLTFMEEDIGGSKHTLMFFHGNAEDIGAAFDFLDCLREQLKVNVIAVEYPGYGLYYGQTTAEQILEDAETVFDFVTDVLNVNPQNIILMGRSIGTGPVTHLASTRSPGASILISPYTCIRDVVKYLVGDFLSYLVADRFNNLEKIKKVRSPCFIIHGQKDTLIPYEQSKQLYQECSQLNKTCHYWFPLFMDHNNYDITKDIIIPIDNFFKVSKYYIKTDLNYLFQVPEQYQTCGDPVIRKQVGMKREGFAGRLYDKIIGQDNN